MKNSEAYLGGECVDDPEGIMTDLGIGSEQYVEALDRCIEMLEDDRSGEDN